MDFLQASQVSHSSQGPIKMTKRLPGGKEELLNSLGKRFPDERRVSHVA